jgi:hypothetical protein
MRNRLTVCACMAGGRISAEHVAVIVAAHSSRLSWRRVAEVREINANVRPLTTASRARRHGWENLYQSCDTEPQRMDGAPPRFRKARSHELAIGPDGALFPATRGGQLLLFRPRR